MTKINILFNMFVLSWFFVYVVLTCSATQHHSTITKAHHTGQKGLNMKINKSTTQYLTIRNRSKLKLTFQTLYPEFISNWTTVKLSGTNKHAMNKLRHELNKKLSTHKRQEPVKPTRGPNTAFIEVETMIPYVPKRSMISKNTQKNNFREPRHQMRISNITQLNLKQSQRLLLQISTTQKEPIESSDLISFRRKSNPSAIDKQVLTRLEQLESDLKVMRTKVKNDTEVIKHLKTRVQEKENKIAAITLNKETNSFADVKTVVKATTKEKSSSIIGSKVKINYDSNKKLSDIKNRFEGKHDFVFDNDRVYKNSERKKILNEEDYKKESNTLKNSDILNSIKNPLEYDSFDLQLENESALREYSELKKKGALPTVKSSMYYRRMFTEDPVNKSSKKHTVTPKKEMKKHIPPPDNYNRRSGTRIFVPEPNMTYNITNSNSNNNSQSKEEVSADDLVENMKTVPSREHWGNKKTHERMVDLNVPSVDTISNNELYHFDQVNHVDEVMKKNSVPLFEKRNVLRKSLDQRMGELFRRHNLRLKEVTEDHLDPLIKSVAATINK